MYCTILASVLTQTTRKTKSENQVNRGIYINKNLVNTDKRKRHLTQSFLTITRIQYVRYDIIIISRQKMELL